jgi:hypothetical protein
MLRTAIYTVSAALAFASIAQADVYKYTDEKGNVQYTDRPLTLPAERLSVSSQHSDVVALEERTNDDTKALLDRDKARQQADKAKADQKKSAAIESEGKAEACNKARQDYLTRMNSQRLFETQPNGERRYFSSQEMDATRASAKQAMDALCN